MGCWWSLSNDGFIVQHVSSAWDCGDFPASKYKEVATNEAQYQGPGGNMKTGDQVETKYVYLLVDSYLCTNVSTQPNASAKGKNTLQPSFDSIDITQPNPPTVTAMLIDEANLFSMAVTPLPMNVVAVLIDCDVFSFCLNILNKSSYTWHSHIVIYDEWYSNYIG